ncbi:MAG: efflux RND transporter periplasmic adaptor subunit [Desulfobacterales bacterium]|nr:efflux RND transporter periplasmic adaptor subunit [Desulfobacterales bacterium]
MGKFDFVKKINKQLLITFLIVFIGVLVSVVILGSKDSVKKRIKKPTLSKVFVIKATPVDHKITIKGYGTVKPIHEINLVSEVSGKIIKVSKNFIDGGSFKGGDTLININTEDYELSLSSAQAKVKDSESKYALAKEESYIAKEEWYQVHGKKNGKKITPLVAKEPQLAAAYANLQANEAEYKKIKLQLDRCAIKAPFNGIVSVKNFDTGQYIAKGQTLGTIFSTESSQISISLKDDELYWIDVPGFTNESLGSRAKVFVDIAGYKKTWGGAVSRAHGKIDTNTRLVNVVISVDKPYENYPPLAAGLFAMVNIEGKTLKNVYILPTESIRDNDMIWIVKKDNTLSFRKINIIKKIDNSVIVNQGIKKGELIVTSNLKLVANGMKVKKILRELIK